jgi:hypothetical protein
MAKPSKQSQRKGSTGGETAEAAHDLDIDKISAAAGSGDVSIDEIGIGCGTNKSSLVQNYLVHYGRMFHDLREQPITLM